MSATVKMDRRWVDIENIHIGERHRAPDLAAVSKLAESIREVGLLNPPAVRFVESMLFDGVEEFNVPVLIAGHHRILALQSIGRLSVECEVYTVDERHAELMEISENLHRAELSVLERSEQVARWIELTRSKQAEDIVSAIDADGTLLRQPDAKLGRPEGGVRKAARELDLSEPEARRSIKVASLSPEAKDVAREVGLDDNQSALLAAARESEPRKQVAFLRSKPTERRQALPKVASLAAKDGPASDIADLKKKLAATKEKLSEKEAQRKAQEGLATIMAQKKREAETRAVYAEADRDKLQDDVEKLQAENDNLRNENADLRSRLGMSLAA